MNAAAKWHPTERQAHKHIPVSPHPSYPPDLVPHNLCIFLSVKMILKDKSTQVIQAAKTVQQKTLMKEDFQNSLESNESDEICVFEMSILRGMNANVSFTVISFLNVNIPYSFCLYLVDPFLLFTTTWSGLADYALASSSLSFWIVPFPLIHNFSIHVVRK